MLGRGLSGPLVGRVFVVTGASSGVGYAVTRRLALNEGATVVAVARRRLFRIQALANQIGEDRVVAVTADMADSAEAQRVIRQVVDRFAHIDGFLHSVNRLLKLTALEVTDQEFNTTMQVNVKSALYAVQALSPVLRKQNSGAIVIYNPTPTPTREFIASEAVYSASANALSALTAGWARQLKECGVTVREIAPDATPDVAGEQESPSEPVIVQTFKDIMCAEQRAGRIPPQALARMPDSVKSPMILSRLGGLTLTRF